MRRPPLVDVHLESGVPAHEHAGRARVVEMDVREHQGARLDRLEQRLDTRGGAGIDHRAVDVERADHTVVAQMHDVYQPAHNQKVTVQGAACSRLCRSRAR